MSPTPCSPLDSNPERPSLVGTSVAGRWQVEAILGVGGMATVYRAVHHRNGHRVALKVLHEELATNDEVRERFFREAYAANQIEHSGVVTALDDGLLDNGTPFLVLTYLEGENLKDRWERNGRSLPWREVSNFTLDVLSVLEAAHLKGIIHRDIKPENLFFTTQGELKLLDFGIAKMDAAESGVKTQSHAAMGTPSFMPPEQARGRWDEVDERSDVFAVAATMFTLLSGRFPHHADTDSETLLSAMTRAAPALLDVAPTVPVELALIVDRGLAFAATDRFESAKSMRIALVEALARLSSGSASPLHGAAALIAEPTPTYPRRATPSDTLPSARPTPKSPYRRKAWLAVALVSSSLVGAGWVHAHNLHGLVANSFSTDPEMAVLVHAEPWNQPEGLWTGPYQERHPGVHVASAEKDFWPPPTKESKAEQRSESSSTRPQNDSDPNDRSSIESLVTATEMELPEVTPAEIRRISTARELPATIAECKDDGPWASGECIIPELALPKGPLLFE